MWYRTLSDSAIRTFVGLLRGLPPTEQVLVLGIMDREPVRDDETDMNMLRDLFSYSSKNQYVLARPDEPARLEYFAGIANLIRKAPSDFPDPENRKRRKLVELPVAQTQAPESRGPTKVEQKAQKKKDRQTLNMLKLHIQSVMDQIKLKYKKFRAPIVDDATISYLYDEQNPEMLTTDLSEEQRQQQRLFRPYELDKDEKGAAGLREVASGKFYYNLEIVTIEKRLSNGYYKRPKDFLADIKRLAKDAKNFGDQDRLLKANEMLANVEVDMTMLEQQQAALVAECEAVYEREQERERERLMKEREAERRGENVPKIVPNVPPLHDSKTTTETSGPVVLGQEVSGRPSLFPVTPGRLPVPSPNSNPWSTPNGSHPSHQTNGSTVPSRPQEDSEMMDSQADKFEQPEHHDPRGWHATATPSQPNTQGQRSQRSAHTVVAQGSQLDQYHNSASTTTSGQKTSDKSGRSSGPYSVNTQHSNGVRDHPDFSTFPQVSGSQIPDTQEQYQSSQSQPASQSSQQMAPPAQLPQNHRQSSISALLNNPVDGADDAKAPPPPPPSRILLDPSKVCLLYTSPSPRD